MRISDWSSDVCSSDLTTTKYVTLGGFVHLSFDDKGNITNTEHGAAVFGDATSYLQVPVKGTGHYDGDFLATMINQESTGNVPVRSEEHTSELQSLMRISYAVFCLKKKKKDNKHTNIPPDNIYQN